jgi:hypothetical protein
MPYTVPARAVLPSGAYLLGNNIKQSTFAFERRDVVLSIRAGPNDSPFYPVSMACGFCPPLEPGIGECVSPAKSTRLLVEHGNVIP